MHVGDAGVTTVLTLLLVVAVVASLARPARIPYEIALVVTGLALAIVPWTPSVTVTPAVILTVFLPVLLFHGAYNLPLADLRANLVPVTVLALPGVVIGAALVGGALRLVGLSWTSALLLGAIIAATDPVSVLAIFGQLGTPQRLTTIVSGESLLNDGTALVLFGVALEAAQGAQVTIAQGVREVAVAVILSPALGAAVGLIGAQVLRRIDDALQETTITLIMAYGGYLLADRLGLSGALETVTAGLLLGTRGESVMSETTRRQARATWEFLNFVANSLVFLLTGLALRQSGLLPGSGIDSRVWIALPVAIVAAVAARVLVVRLTRLVTAGTPLPASWDAVLVWAGMRGAVSLAAALSLPPDLPDRQLLQALTFGVVLFTLVVQGLTVGPLLVRLGLCPPPP